MSPSSIGVDVYCVCVVGGLSTGVNVNAVVVVNAVITRRARHR